MSVRLVGLLNFAFVKQNCGSKISKEMHEIPQMGFEICGKPADHGNRSLSTFGTWSASSTVDLMKIDARIFWN